MYALAVAGASISPRTALHRRREGCREGRVRCLAVRGGVGREEPRRGEVQRDLPDGHPRDKPGFPCIRSASGTLRVPGGCRSYCGTAVLQYCGTALFFESYFSLNF